MNWLVDAQLPPRLCEWLQLKGDSCQHVVGIPSGISRSDELIWSYAREHGYRIVTKDRDFFERSFVMGTPPQVVLISVGNCSNERLMNILEHWWKEIKKAIEDGHAVIVVMPDEVQRY